MKISADMVRQLRERTGAGMMECKKALVAAEGDLEVASENLRKAGIAKADKKAGRVAAEGVIAAAVTDDGKRGVLVEVNSETDFVGNGDDFRGFASTVAKIALDLGGEDVDAVSSATFDDGKTVDEARRELTARVGENITVRRVAVVESGGTIAHYSHGGRIGVLVAYEGGDAELGQDLAMHVAAAQPQYLDESAVPADQLAKEREILIAQAEGSGKPANIIEKMVEGRLRKFLGEITLLGQPFVKDPDMSVKKLVSNAKASVSAYRRFEVGEGIDKGGDDFAAEVAALSGGGS
ncbi:MAG: translation elongation factor Ts [Pseudomonadota bacterium]